MRLRRLLRATPTQVTHKVTGLADHPVSRLYWTLATEPSEDTTVALLISVAVFKDDAATEVGLSQLNAIARRGWSRRLRRPAALDCRTEPIFAVLRADGCRASFGSLGDEADPSGHNAMLLTRRGTIVRYLWVANVGHEPMSTLISVHTLIQDRQAGDHGVDIASIPKYRQWSNPSTNCFTGGIWDMLPTLKDVPETLAFRSDSPTLRFA